MHTSYEHKYDGIATRSRRSLQRYALQPSDPMADPENHPGERRLSREERMNALVSMD